MKPFNKYWSYFIFLVIIALGMSLGVVKITPEVWRQNEDLILGLQATASPTPVSTNSARESVTVKKVIDGDTIELSDGRKLRYIGMDTPETRHPTKGVQCFGAQSKERNKELVEGKTVQLEKDVSETDRYGRLLRYVWLNDTLVNQQLVEEGYAVARSYPPDIARQTQLREAERRAQEQSKGLWGSCDIENKNLRPQN